LTFTNSTQWDDNVNIDVTINVSESVWKGELCIFPLTEAWTLNFTIIASRL